MDFFFFGKIITVFWNLRNIFCVANSCKREKREYSHNSSSSFNLLYSRCTGKLGIWLASNVYKSALSCQCKSIGCFIKIGADVKPFYLWMKQGILLLGAPFLDELWCCCSQETFPSTVLEASPGLGPCLVTQLQKRVLNKQVLRIFILQTKAL